MDGIKNYGFKAEDLGLNTTEAREVESEGTPR